MRRFFILRGVQGSGKSTLADDLLIAYPNGVAVSTDNFWLTPTGEYKFDPRKLKEAHQWCFDQFRMAVAADFKEIILDNTNIRVAHFEKYVEYAETYGYTVIVISISPDSVDNLVERQAHGVPEDTIARGIVAFEPWPHSDFC